MVPYSYQIEGVRKITRFGGRVLLADDMGLGKSLQALWWLVRNPRVRPVLIICPASLKFNWEREASKHFGIRVCILSGTRQDRVSRFESYNFFVINYDILSYWKDFLIELNPQCVVLDESHYCSSPSTQRTKNTAKICNKSPYIIAISGTPINSRPVELFPVLNMIRPDLFSSFFRFATRYCGAKRNRFGWDFRGASNLDELNDILYSQLMIRRTKSDVLSQLPSKSRIVISLPLENRKEYNKALHDFSSWLNKNHGKVISSEAHALVKVGYLKRLSAELKLNYAIEWIHDFLQSGEKLVIGAVHKKIIKRLKEEFGRYCTYIDGSVSSKDRQIAIDNFRNNKNIKVIILQIRSGGVGINLPESCSMCILELDWTPSAHIQLEDRIHRIGQKRNVTIYYMIAIDTIEELIMKAIHRKQGVVSSSIDSCYKEVFDSLIKKLKKKR